MIIDVYPEHLEIIPDPEKTQADVAVIKKLPGRYYNEGGDNWIVPIRPGLSAALAKQNSFLGDTVIAVIEDTEARVIEAMKAPCITQVDIWKMPAAISTAKAIAFHFYSVHNGDPNDYNNVHGYPKLGE